MHDASHPCQVRLNDDGNDGYDGGDEEFGVDVDFQGDKDFGVDKAIGENIDDYSPAIGDTFNKVGYSLAKYSKCAMWCNTHNATIEDKGFYYECVPIPPKPLEEIKANKIAQLKAERDAKELEPITFNGYSFDFDKDAIMRMELAERSLRGTDQGITWTDADNNRVNNVNADDLNAILIQGTIRSNELHIRYNELKALVNQATSVDEVESIIW